MDTHSEKFKGEASSMPGSPTKSFFLPSPYIWRGTSDSPSVAICPFTVPILVWQRGCNTDQRQSLKQYGAGLTLIVLSMVLVQGLDLRWMVAFWFETL